VIKFLWKKNLVLPRGKLRFFFSFLGIIFCGKFCFDLSSFCHAKKKLLLSRLLYIRFYDEEFLYGKKIYEFILYWSGNNVSDLSFPTLPPHPFFPPYLFLFSVQTYLFICQKKKMYIGLIYFTLNWVCVFLQLSIIPQNHEINFFSIVSLHGTHYARNSFKINILPPTFIRVNLKN